MFITMIVSSFLLLGGVGIFVYRYLVYTRLNQIKDLENYEPTFQRKLTYVKQKETERHIFYLLILAFLLLISLFVGTISTYQLTKASDASQKEIRQLQEEVTRLNEARVNQQAIGQTNDVQQNEEASKVDLNLTSYQWKEVFENKNQSEKNRIEVELSKELKSYFNVETVKVTLVNNKTMNLFLIGESTITDDSEQLLARVNEFVKQANDIPELSQLRFESDKALKNDDKSILYSRKTNQETFKEQSNNNSKMKEGKG